MTKHTPAPWDASLMTTIGSHTEIKDPVEISVLDQHGYRAVLALVFNVDDDRDAQTSDANLIAAAPELLAALRSTIPFIQRVAESSDEDSDQEMLKAALDAIAKAEGRE